MGGYRRLVSLLIVGIPSLVLASNAWFPQGPTTIDSIGPCRYSFQADPSYTYNQFAREQTGVWVVRKHTYTDFFSRVGALLHSGVPTGNGQFQVKLVYVLQNKTTGVFTEGLYTYGWPVVKQGTIQGRPITIKFFPLRSGQDYVYTYACSDQGGANFDLRFVRSKRPMTPNEEARISVIDRWYGFRGILINIYKC